jgi:hypothetical protein
VNAATAGKPICVRETMLTFVESILAFLSRSNDMTTQPSNNQPVAQSKGFYVDPKAWELAPNPTYAENPPDDWEDCGCCDGAHPPGYSGDCRSDINRWPSEACISALTGGNLK